MSHPTYTPKDRMTAWALYAPREVIKNVDYPENLPDAIKELFNCREAEVDENGDVWIAGAQRGGWLDTEGLQKIAVALVLGDI